VQRRIVGAAREEGYSRGLHGTRGHFALQMNATFGDMGAERRIGTASSEGTLPMPLEMKSECEKCRSELSNLGEAYICSFECTFCSLCAQEMQHKCPNCAGEVIRRPRRDS